MTVLRHALRQLAKSPGFTLVAVLTLALCIGANSAIFSVVNAVLLRPFPFPEAERLVYVNNSYPKNDLARANVSIPDYLDRVGRAPSIASAMLYHWESTNLATQARPTRVAGVRATPSMFATLQVQPAIGRPFDEANAAPGSEHVVILSDSLWRESYGARTDVIGETIRLNGVPHAVIGVMPESFYFPEPGVKLWTPFAFTPQQKSDDERGHEFSWMLARLQPGATPAQLEQECATIIAQNLEGIPAARAWVETTGFCAIVESMSDVWVAEARPMLWLVQAGVIAALLIGCANVANLLLTRAVARERELAIRAALGAGRWRLIRQLATESLVLFIEGGALGLLVAMWGLSATDAFGVAALPRGESVQLDRAVFLFTLVSAVLTGLAFGLLPAWQGSRADAADALRDAGTRTTSGRRQRRLRHGLVIVEVALSIMLLTTAGLLYRSFERLQQQSPGFDPSSVLTARLTLPEAKYPTDDQRRAFADRLVGVLRALPGVEAVGFTDVVPFGYSNSQGTYRIAGQESNPGQPPPHGMIRSVSPDYFAAMKIPVMRGRGFTAQDAAESEQVVVIDRVLADRYWPGQDPVGQFLYRGENKPGNLRKIVGVVATVKHSGLDDPTSKETLYFPYAQRPVESFTLVVRTALRPDGLISATRQAVLGIDAEQPLFDIQTLASRMDGKLQRQRTPMLLIGLFSGMALLLAALGVYGVLAFTVGQRTHEFGIRTALGATAGDVLRLVLRQGLLLVATGVVLGVAGYLGVSRFLQHLVFQITPLDPVSLIVGPALLFVVALIACWLPARRATKVDPLVALRAD